MAAYAALVSLMYTIDQIEHHPRPPISLDKSQVESITEKVKFLQEFLEGYSLHTGYSKEADGVESRIADAAYATEDVIESDIVDQIHAGSTSRGKNIIFVDSYQGPKIKTGYFNSFRGQQNFNFFRGQQKASYHVEEISSIDFYRELQKVIEDMDTIKKEVMEIKEKMGVQDQLWRSSVSVGSLRSSSTRQYTMVGFDDVLLEIMDKLTGGYPDRQIIPIVGMGGIGKTTLARNVYQNPIVVQHFDILVWVTISQEFKMGEILLKLLGEKGGGDSIGMNEYELGVRLHKRLSGRRYLIVMDDIWDIQMWDQLKFFFPDNNNGSRIMLTTRLSNLASEVAASPGIDMAFLDEGNSWNLFSKTVFGEEGYSIELEEIGKKIVKNCKGLPLSIVVIAGLLAKSKYTREYWEYIEENLNSIVNSEDNESCLKVLHMSYVQLPVYLKPCFLYMGIFPEDSLLHVSMLIKLWVAEGFLKPINGKSLEEIAKEYLKELIDRNLILTKLGPTGNIKYCNIHDLLRDMCLREAQKERFYNVTRQHSFNLLQGINAQRRVVIPRSTSKEKLDALQSMSLARSLICDTEEDLPLRNFRLLRILQAYDEDYHRGHEYYLGHHMFELVNSRYISIAVRLGSQFPSSVCLLWNLQTLIFHSARITAPVEIWKMPQLRHVVFRQAFGGLYLLDPPSGYVGQQDGIVLGNLQTLERIINFKCGEEVVKRIPNIRKLKIEYERFASRLPNYYLNNLERLHELESFGCNVFTNEATDFMQNITFPHSLKKLTLATHDLQYWEDMLEKVGSLPLLEKFILEGGRINGRKWETVEGQFCSLKLLKIDRCEDLEYWTTESSHFPRLEHLELRSLSDLKEIPSEIGDIPTLKLISVYSCSDSTIISAKRILDEQEELGNEGLRVEVTLDWRNGALQMLASPNFQVVLEG